jgi:predicted nucleic acid-binding protein
VLAFRRGNPHRLRAGGSALLEWLQPTRLRIPMSCVILRSDVLRHSCSAPRATVCTFPTEPSGVPAGNPLPGKRFTVCATHNTFRCAGPPVRRPTVLRLREQEEQAQAQSFTIGYLTRRHATSPLQALAYAAFQQTLRYFATWQVLDFSQAAFEQFSALRQQRIRIGSQDLRIAAITLTNAATLVTRNTRDFAQVPGLLIEDWSAM